MTDFYLILGISKTANEIEIKHAFRKLAKIYHPDKNPDNPEAKQLFQTILKAYNTLRHPAARSRYDLRESGYSTTQFKQTAKRKTQKEWTFTEEEMERRQYYEKYYKAKQHEKASRPAVPVKPHSDFKYILFATPIAIALLMFVISIFTHEPITISKTESQLILQGKKSQNITDETLNPKSGVQPYTGYFGGIKTFVTENTLQIKNISAADAVIVIFDIKTNTYLQHGFLQAGHTVTFNKLPVGELYIKTLFGKKWNSKKLLMHDAVQGGFDSIIQFQKVKFFPVSKSDKDNAYTIEIIGAPSQKNKYITDENDFFYKN